MFLPVSLFGESRKLLTGPPPFHHSIEEGHHVELKVSYYGPCSLRKFSGSFEHMSPIEMRNALLSKNLISLQRFHDVQIKPIYIILQ